MIISSPRNAWSCASSALEKTSALNKNHRPCKTWQHHATAPIYMYVYRSIQHTKIILYIYVCNIIYIICSIYYTNCVSFVLKNRRLYVSHIVQKVLRCGRQRIQVLPEVLQDIAQLRRHGVRFDELRSAGTRHRPIFVDDGVAGFNWYCG